MKIRLSAGGLRRACCGLGVYSTVLLAVLYCTCWLFRGCQQAIIAHNLQSDCISDHSASHIFSLFQFGAGILLRRLSVFTRKKEKKEKKEKKKEKKGHEMNCIRLKLMIMKLYHCKYSEENNNSNNTNKNKNNNTKIM